MLPSILQRNVAMEGFLSARADIQTISSMHYYESGGRQRPIEVPSMFHVCAGGVLQDIVLAVCLAVLV